VTDPANIADIPTSTLSGLLSALDSRHLGTPVTREALAAYCAKNQVALLYAVLGGHSKPACLTIVRSVLEERARNTRPRPELVWTGPEGIQAHARDTAVVLRELFESARRRVVLAGYSFTDAQSVLRPLQEVMVAYGVEAHFFVNVAQPEHAPADEEAYETGPSAHPRPDSIATAAPSVPVGAPSTARSTPSASPSTRSAPSSPARTSPSAPTTATSKPASSSTTPTLPSSLTVSG
jgi:hypothetical protein